VFAISRYWLGGELRDAVHEANPFDQFAQSFDRGDPVPALLRFERELQHHRERPVLAVPLVDVGVASAALTNFNLPAPSTYPVGPTGSATNTPITVPLRPAGWHQGDLAGGGEG